MGFRHVIVSSLSLTSSLFAYWIFLGYQLILNPIAQAFRSLAIPLSFLLNSVVLSLSTNIGFFFRAINSWNMKSDDCIFGSEVGG